MYQFSGEVEGNSIVKIQADFYCSVLNILEYDLSGMFRYFLESSSMIQNSIISFYFSVSQDLKDEKQKARMAAARAVLEKCTMMLLTASKVCVEITVVPPAVLHATKTQTGTTAPLLLHFLLFHCGEKYTNQKLQNKNPDRKYD